MEIPLRKRYREGLNYGHQRSPGNRTGSKTRLKLGMAAKALLPDQADKIRVVNARTGHARMEVR